MSAREKMSSSEGITPKGVGEITVESRTFYPNGKIHARRLSNGNTEYFDKAGKMYAIKFPDESMEYYEDGVLRRRTSAGGKEETVKKLGIKARKKTTIFSGNALDDTIVTGINRRLQKQENGKQERKKELIEAWGENLIEKWTNLELAEIERRIRIAKDQDVRDVFETKKKLLQEKPEEYFNKEIREVKNKKKSDEFQKIIKGLEYINREDKEKTKAETFPPKTGRVLMGKKIPESKMDKTGSYNMSEWQRAVEEANLKAEKVAKERRTIFEKFEKVREASAQGLSKIYRTGVEKGMKGWKRWGNTIKAGIFGVSVLGAGAIYLEKSAQVGIEADQHTGIASSANLIREARGRADARERETEELARAQKENVELQKEKAKASADFEAQEKLKTYLEQQKAQREAVAKMSIKNYAETVNTTGPVIEVRDDSKGFVQEGDTGAFPTAEPLEQTPEYLRKNNNSPEPTEVKTFSPSPVERIKAEIENNYPTLKSTENSPEPEEIRENFKIPEHLKDMPANEIINEKNLEGKDPEFVKTVRYLQELRKITRLSPKGSFWRFREAESVGQYIARASEIEASLR